MSHSSAIHGLNALQKHYVQTEAKGLEGYMSDTTSPLAYLALGANLGDRLENLRFAIEKLSEHPEINIVKVSSVYETEPVGGPPQPDYLNAVVAVETTLTARELLETALSIEQEANRVRAEKWGPRTLDIDVLLVGEEKHDEPGLEIPHPRMWERPFVLVPLYEIAPQFFASPPDNSGVRLFSQDIHRG